MTITLAPDARRSVGLFSTGLGIIDHKPKIAFAKGTKSDRMVLTVTDMPVFRSGTFRDSMGYQHTWESIHIDQMVMHYSHLASNGIFSDVPVRKGHGSFLGDPMDSLIGWHTGLRAETMTSTHDGNEYSYLLASYEIFDEEAAARVEGGDWRNRSSEVGFYLTNAEAEYWPVYQGFAYVDIPAVEGLNGFSKAVKSRSNFSMMMEEETADMAETPEEKAAREAAEAAAATPPAAAAPPAEQAAPPAEQPPAEQPVQQAAAVPPVQPVVPAETDHSAAGGVQLFTLGDGRRVDFATAQAHITTLETANDEREKTVRAGFVNQLASDNKIPATQIEALTNHAQGLTPEQYASWSASYDAVPASGLFGSYGASGGDGNTPATGGQQSAQAGEIATLEGVVALHARTMTREQLEETDSFKRLTALRAAQTNQ